jgi:hypothetical protein
VDVFGHGVNFTSASEYVYDDGYDQMVWYILNNCSQVDKYVKYVVASIPILILCIAD